MRHQESVEAERLRNGFKTLKLDLELEKSGAEI